MSCTEKRHVGHRGSSNNMLHHRFPNGFAESFMDETDKEVSSLTDRAFRSLCVGDEAVYNDEFSYGFSPFSCHKPLVEEPSKKTHENAKKKHTNSANNAQRWGQKKGASNVSSLLNAFSATEERSESMLIKNGDSKDSNGDSWDKSALLSIQRELSEFSLDYHNNITDGHFNQNKKSSSKTKNGKAGIKRWKLNIKNFFLHSEFSPFQSWRDFNSFSFVQEDITSIRPMDNLPKWYESPLYKQLTEAHRNESLHTEETGQGQKPVEPTAPPPPPPRPPPKVLPKPSAPEKRCTSDGSETSAPWRRNRVRAKSAVPGNQPSILSPPNDRSKQMEESPLPSAQKKVKSVEVKTVEEISSVASTPFSISQLVTPVIPSRQPTETSEILSPSLLDLPFIATLSGKVTPEPQVKRDSYKSIASSLLFNLKDNRKRVKSRYSPPKFKSSEITDRRTQSPKLDQTIFKYGQAGSDGTASGFSTPAILKDGQPICSPLMESNNAHTVALRKYIDSDRPISDDYLISNLLQTKREAMGSRSLSDVQENGVYDGSPFAHTKLNKSPMVNKQSYPSLNLYKKASSSEPEMKYLPAPLNKDTLSVVNKDSPTTQYKGLSPNISETKGLSPNISETKGLSPNISETKGLSANIIVDTKRPVKEIVALKEKDVREQALAAREVIRTNRDALNTRNKLLSSTTTDTIKRPLKDKMELKERDVVEQAMNAIELIRANRDAFMTGQKKVLSPNRPETLEAITVNRTSNVRTEAPPVKDAIMPEHRHFPSVPRRNNAKQESQAALEQYQIEDRFTNGDVSEIKEKEPVKKKGRFKHVFSARQNNYIKSQRYTVVDDDEEEEDEEDDEVDREVNTDVVKEAQYSERTVSMKDMKDSEQIVSDLHALKDLERARLGDNVKHKPAGSNIDEEAKAKNDLISRELRNIKRGMLSMRSNTIAKREEEKTKENVFSKIDSNVVVNKSLINNNYDKAKMALEEIISDRADRLKSKVSKNKDDRNTLPEESPLDDSYAIRVQERKQARQDSEKAAEEKLNNGVSAQREKEVREWLGDLRDHNQMKHILSQNETKHGETHKSVARVSAPDLDRVHAELNRIATRHSKYTDKEKLREEQEKLLNNVYSDENKEREKDHIKTSEEREGNVSSTDGERHTLVETRESKINSNDQPVKKERRPEVASVPPEVPPRSKKGITKKEGSVEREIECAPKDEVEEDMKNRDSSIKDEQNDSMEPHVVKEKGQMRGKVSGLKEKYDKDPEAVTAKVTDVTPNKIKSVKRQAPGLPKAKTDARINAFETDVATERSKHSKCSPAEKSVEKVNEMEVLLNEKPTNALPKREPMAENKNPESWEHKSERSNSLELSNQERVTYEDETTESVVKNQATENPDKTNRISEDILNVEESVQDIHRETLASPLLLHGNGTNPSQPDQNSMSSKSSYFSVESASQRNIESDSNVYQSLENLIAEIEEVDEQANNVSEHVREDLERTEVEYYSVSDHESEPEVEVRPVVSPRRDGGKSHKDYKLRERETEEGAWVHSSADKANNQTPTSQSNAFSPTMGKPALFKVKDNTFTSPPITKTIRPVLHKTNQDTVQLWSPRGSLSGSERGEEELYHPKESTETDKHFNPKETAPLNFPHSPLSPPRLASENGRKAQYGSFLTVPEEDDRHSGVSPSSEGVDSLADEILSSNAATEDNGGSKVTSERSGSVCSGNDSQGLGRPPVVAPKSEKALLRAMKLTTRRIQKEESKNKPVHKSRSSSKRDKQRSDTSENKSSSSSSEKHGSSEKRHRERSERSNHSSEKHSRDRTDNSGRSSGRNSHGSSEHSSRSGEKHNSGSSEHQGRSSGTHSCEKPEHIFHSNDRHIPDVPEHRGHNSERSTTGKQPLRAQSNDRYINDRTERRICGSENSVRDRNQHIEQSIIDELQQRGRTREKPTRDKPERRRHSIDSYGSDAVDLPSHRPNVSRQSSYTGQLSRQSSYEHAYASTAPSIVTQSFPMTQRKLLQDPDSGQYFVVDMPVQIKTKTFFDPETGNYVQLPVQPQEGAVPQASTMEMLNAPKSLVLYHGFVPVPVSSLPTQTSTGQVSYLDQEDFEQRLERSRQKHNKERHPYLEPVYGSQDHMLGEFLGSEELDCVS